MNRSFAVGAIALLAVAGCSSPTALETPSGSPLATVVETVAPPTEPPTPEPTLRPVVTAAPAPPAAPPVQHETSSNCDPAYPDFCIPPPPPDLNCKDVAPHKKFTVKPPDPHHFDSDGDGIGCES